VTGVTERVSVDSAGVEGNGDSRYPAISADGEVVGFASLATNLVAGDTNGNWDVFVHDRVSGVTERVSVDSGGAQGNGASDSASLSFDGRLVAFRSDASNLVAGDANLAYDVFVHDRVTLTTQRVSVDSGGNEGDDGSHQPSFASNGQFVAFYSYATNLVAGDANGCADVFVRDLSAATTGRVSVDSAGNEGDDGSYWPSISADGRNVAFFSDATNLVAADVNGASDVFVHDRLTGATTFASVDSAGAHANGASTETAISGDGRVVAFHSFATNLVTGDTNGSVDVFVHERCSIDGGWANYGNGFPGTLGVPTLAPQSNPVLGASLTIDLDNSSGAATVALLFIGFQQTSIPSSWGGELVVVPLITIVVGIAPGATPFSGDLPDDDTLCGVTVDLQAIESDPGAAKGVSFTPGLELVLGN
jgi:Tol biopolymer transport system component